MINDMRGEFVRGAVQKKARGVPTGNYGGLALMLVVMSRTIHDIEICLAKLKDSNLPKTFEEHSNPSEIPCPF